jgi:hypothetical protein
LAYQRGFQVAFTLLEVMIACGIFFMATFTILALVSSTLRNARALQRDEVDIGMAAAMVYQTLKTNRYEEGSLNGDFGNTYPDYSFEARWGAWKTNGLLAVEIVLNKRGARGPADAMTIWVYSPNARSSFGPTFR